MTEHASRQLINQLGNRTTQISSSTRLESASDKTRLFFVDNLRIFLTILVVVHHIAIGYGGIGYWAFKEVPTDGISPIFLTLFCAINQSFFMSLFFLLSGFFVPGAFDKKGAAAFIKDRFVRLGVPILVYAIFIAPFIDYLVMNFVKGKEVTYYQMLISRIESLSFSTGPLWFVEALLLFTLIYVGLRLFSQRFLNNFNFVPFSKSFPSTRSIIISMAVLILGSYIVRTWQPEGAYFYRFQLGHFVHYVFCFWIGILAYRGKWFEQLTAERAKPWNKTALVNTIILPLIFVYVMTAGYKLEDCMGGGTWLSLLKITWETISCLSISIWLLSLFKSRFNYQNGLAKTMSPNAYTVYLIHLPVVAVVMVFFFSISLPSIVKFFIVSLISITLCFLVSHFIFRKIPCSKRVLG